MKQLFSPTLIHALKECGPLMFQVGNDVKNDFVILPLGGLGNQLFVYSVGRSLAMEHGSRLLIDNSWFEGNEHRRFELNSFRHSGVVVSQVWKQSLVGRFPWIHRFLRLAGQSPHLGRTYREFDFGFDRRVLSLPDGTHLEGYFQSYKYFCKYESDIRKEIFDLTAPSYWYSSAMESQEVSEPWIALHIRRGDYLHSSTREFHGVLGVDYYKRALKLMDTLLGALPIRVFTDDPLGARQVMSALERRFALIEPPQSSPPIESMLLMTRGAGVICANSSFSWWGAWLGEHPERPVICPRPWFDSRKVDYRDLLLEQWISLGRI